MSNVFRDPTFLNSVLVMREQMEALRPQYESAARAVVHMKALNDSVEQSLAAARDIDLGVGGNLASIYGTDLAEAARASIGNIVANVEALKANIDSGYGIQLEAVSQSLVANYNIDLEAMKASLAAAYSIDRKAMRASFAGGLGVDLEAAQASLAAAQNVDLEAMRASLAGGYGVDLEAVKEMLAGAHDIDFDDLAWPEEPPDVPADDADQFDGRATDDANAPPDARDRVDGGTPAKAGRMRRAWEVFQVLLTVDTVLGNPGTTTLREAVGGAANEVLLFLWLATVAQVPSPPPAPAMSVPEAHTTATNVTEVSLMDSDRLAERQPVTMENGLGVTDRDEESDRTERDDSR